MQNEINETIISMFYSDCDELPYCTCCSDMIEGRNYSISTMSKADPEEKGVLMICEPCFDKIINLKQVVDQLGEYDEITIINNIVINRKEFV